MSNFLRIIPKLDIKSNNLVKGVNLEGLRVLGRPEIFAKKYYDEGADEIFFQDVVASLLGRNNIHEVISRTAKEVFIPLTVGGGIRNLKDIYDILRSGADKVSINSAAINNPSFIYEAVNIYGSSTITISTELIKKNDHKYYVYTENGRNDSGILALNWFKEIKKMKVGEVVVTFVDTEGTGEGIDFEYISKIKNFLDCPIIVHGGLGNKKQVGDLLNYVQIDGLAIASMFHYHLLDKSSLNIITEGNVDFLNNIKVNKKINTTTIKELKNYIELNTQIKVNNE